MLTTLLRAAKAMFHYNNPDPDLKEHSVNFANQIQSTHQEAQSPADVNKLLMFSVSVTRHDNT